MKTRLIFIRHAESVAKERGIVQGSGLDVPLSEHGKEQVKALKKVIRTLVIDRLFSSTALRAIETVAPFRELFSHVPYEALDVLNERSKGEAEGITKETFVQKYRHVEEAWRREEDPRPPGGESFADVEQRVMPVIQGHVRAHCGETILYVGHGNVFRVIVGAILGVPVEKRNRIQKDCCSMTVVEYDMDRDRWHVLSLNQPLI